MRFFRFPFFSSVLLLAGSALSFTEGARASLPRDDQNSQRSLQDPVLRTDLIRLIPFEVQIAMQDETSAEDSKTITETLYQGGNLLTDSITDWMTASFESKTAADQSMISNYTSFDSIALELANDSTSKGTIEGQQLTLIQVNFEGVSLWERQGTGTPPVEPEVVELIQRATFLDDRSLKAALETTINNLLFDLGVDSVNGVQPITIVDVRAYITPPGSSNQDDNKSQEISSAGDGSDSNPNRNLEIIIIVAIVVACLAFALLIFAVVWAWRSDRKERDDKPSSSSSGMQNKRSKANPSKPRVDPVPYGGSGGNKTNAQPVSDKRLGNGTAYQPTSEVSSIEQSSYDLPNNTSDGSYPRVIGNTNANDNDSGADYPDDSVISEDVSSSLSAYYKSGMAYSGSKASSTGRLPSNFNDAASMSSMDSYGYSLDGYAPSLGPAQGGYPVGPLQAARDAPMPLGDESDTFKKLQDEESIADYEAMPVAEA